MIPRPARKSFVSPWGVRRLKNWDFANGTGDVKAEVPPFLDLREHPLASIQWRTWQVRKTASDLLDVWPTMMKFDEFDKKLFFGIVVSLIMNSSKKCDNYISHCLNFFLCVHQSLESLCISQEKILMFYIRLARFPHFPREREMNLRENSHGKWGAGNCRKNWPTLV